MGNEINNQRILHREHRVGREVGISLDEHMGRDGFVPGSRHDDMRMGRPVRVAAHFQQHPAYRPVGRDCITDRLDGPEFIPALCVGTDAPACAHLAPGSLHIVLSVAVGRPDIQRRTGDRLPVRRRDLARKIDWLARNARGDIGTKRHFRCTGHVERPQHRRLGGPGRLSMINRIDQHRHA